jgi:cupin fold WbuC family metalloprotein
MKSKLFEAKFFDALTATAFNSPRLRQHRNIHVDYQDNCQRLFNAIEPGSYIRPHRHALDPRDELLVAIRGVMVLITFDNLGEVKNIVKLTTEKFDVGSCSAIEVSPLEWHTVIALRPGSILLEVKAGPFDPSKPKEPAEWAPPENSVEATKYLKYLIEQAQHLEQK